MITITLRLSESLLSILRDGGSDRPETRKIRVARGATVREILAAQNINPLLVPMASVTREGRSLRVDMDTQIFPGDVLTLYGPLAGG